MCVPLRQQLVLQDGEAALAGLKLHRRADLQRARFLHVGDIGDERDNVVKWDSAARAAKIPRE